MSHSPLRILSYRLLLGLLMLLFVLSFTILGTTAWSWMHGELHNHALEFISQHLRFDATGPSVGVWIVITGFLGVFIAATLIFLFPPPEWE